MDKRYSSGFTMVEMLLVVMLISMVSLILGVPYIVSTKGSEMAASDTQLEAMATGKTIPFQQGLTFNHKGNINQAKTLKFGGRTCVYQLGMGRYYCD